MNKYLSPSLLALGLGTAGLTAQAGLITFEDQAVIGTVITTQYQASDGVIFNVDPSGNLPKIGKFGGVAGNVPPANGLEGFLYNPDAPTALPDHLIPGEGAFNGETFITDIIGLKPATAYLRVEYVDPVAALSFDLMDIDGYQAHLVSGSVESYTIRIYDVANALLDTILVSAGVEGSGVASGVDSFGKLVGDGVVSRFGFNRGVNDIKYLEIDGSRPAGNFGLAFDNFNTASFSQVPEPASIAILGTGLLGLVFARRRKSV